MEGQFIGVWTMLPCVQVQIMSGLKILNTTLTYSERAHFFWDEIENPQIARLIMTSDFLRFAFTTMEKAFGRSEFEDSLSSWDTTCETEGT